MLDAKDDLPMPEEMPGDIRARLVSVERDTSAHAHRITALEQARVRSEIDDARKEEQIKHMNATLSGVDSKLDKINDNIVWAIKVGIGAFIVAVIGFVISGGLSIPK